MMKSYENLLLDLRPIRFGEWASEPFDEYWGRVAKLLPAWPQCAARNWLHRHYSDAVRVYGWLRFDKFQFERQEWLANDIYSQVQSHKMKMIEGQGVQIMKDRTSRSSWLQRYMWDNGNWPAPIILLRNSDGICSPRRETYGVPYQLLEGHLRLGYFRHLFRANDENLSDLHSVWIVDTEVASMKK